MNLLITTRTCGNRCQRQSLELPSFPRFPVSHQNHLERRTKPPSGVHFTVFRCFTSMLSFETENCSSVYKLKESLQDCAVQNPSPMRTDMETEERNRKRGRDVMAGEARKKREKKAVGDD